uniref:Protein phosphatase n=1 Tax=Lankesteria abbotti TaxID=340204 RepID=A0A7S2VUA2_9APIC
MDPQTEVMTTEVGPSVVMSSLALNTHGRAVTTNDKRSEHLARSMEFPVDRFTPPTVVPETTRVDPPVPDPAVTSEPSKFVRIDLVDSVVTTPHAEDPDREPLPGRQHTGGIRWLSRRASFEAFEVRRNFNRQIRRRALNSRRRKTESEKALTLAAEEIRHLDGLKKAVGRNSTCPVMLPPKSTLSQGELDGVDSPFSFNDSISREWHKGSAQRASSLVHFSRANIMESWPSSATDLLTGGQSVRDRLFFFWHVERLVRRLPGRRSVTRRNTEVFQGRNMDINTNNVQTTSSKPNVTRQVIRMGSQLADRLQCTPGTSPGAVEPKICGGIQLTSGCFCIPHLDKLGCGEDSHFTVDGEQGVLGVADGVGQWSEFGCDPSLFSKVFTLGCVDAWRSLREPTDKNGVAGGNDTAADGRNLLNSSKKLSKTWNNTVMSYGCEVCSANCLRAKAGSSGPPTDSAVKPSALAVELLKKGYASTRGIWGACTALVATLDANGSTLGVANLGDSAMLVLRRELTDNRLFTVIRKTQEQQHSFNCPYQLSRVPVEEDYPTLDRKGWTYLKRLLIESRMACNGPSPVEGDDPVLAELYDIRVTEGDLVIVGTDGLFDNLFDHEIAHLASLSISPYEAKVVASAGALCDATTGKVPHPHFVTPPEIDELFGIATPPQKIARALAEAAFFRACDPTARTPFARVCRRSRQPVVSGGKMDDISVVVGWVVQPSKTVM